MMSNPDTPGSVTPEPPPSPPEVRPAQSLFDRGDYRGATAALRALLATNPPAEVAAAARDLLSRMAPDPWSLRFGAGALALVIVVSIAYLF